MSRASYVYTIQDDFLYLKLAGKCNYSNCGGLEKLLHTLSQQQADFERIIIDLSELIWIDSTVLGLIAGLNNMQKGSQSQPIIVTSNADIVHLLISLSFNRFFNIMTTSPAFVEKYKELAESQLSEKEQAETILEAHKNLIKLSPENLEQFKDVIELFEESLHSSSGEKHS